jgi:hypothetical protein
MHVGYWLFNISKWIFLKENKIGLIAMKKFVFLIILSILFLIGCKKEDPINIDDTLVEVINKYRLENNLSEIPVSSSLTTVAETHARDLAENYVFSENCNLHSWSDKGNWVPLCYTPDHANAQLMWDKPRELTTYPGNGYEIAVFRSDSITTSEALELWKNSEAHLNVILNRGIWKDLKWNAIGGAINKGYAVVWFGVEVDPEK